MPHRRTQSSSSLLARRAVLALCAAALVLSAFLGLSRGQDAGAGVSEPPNVVVILVDDQDPWSMRVMKKTKRLIAGKGVHFRRHYATFPLCCPSRASLLTGQYAHNHGVLSNVPPAGGYPSFKDQQDDALPVALQAAGYRTAWVGKYLNHYGKAGTDFDLPPGWDNWIAPVRAAHMLYRYGLTRNGVLYGYGARPDDYGTDVYARLAAREIRRAARRDQPFFTVLSTLAPHREPPGRVDNKVNPRPAPRHAKRFRDKSIPRPASFNEADLSDKPEYLRKDRLKKNARRQLQFAFRSRLGSLLAVDDAVAALVREVRRAGELDNTYIVYASDNGFLLGQHRMRGKGALYEESARVPLLMRGPGIPAGVKRDQVVGNVDLAPTIYEVTGAAPLRPYDGESLLDYAAEGGYHDDRAILLQSRSAVGVRTGRYVYIEHRSPPTSFELYDLEADPLQIQNLIGPENTQTAADLPAGVDPGQVPGIVDDLQDLLDDLRDCDGPAECIVLG